MKDLISIIIPVYNVEKYIRKCLESVCNQIYRDIEIILVDDGSTDLSGVICDEYANRDKRIRVIHKSNGGLADARNEGLKIATGEYVGFVDSDDWIEPDMYSTLYELCKKNDLDLIAARFIEEKDGKKSDTQYSGEFCIMSGVEMLENNISEKPRYIVTNSVWDRLYRRTLLEDLAFPVGKCYEDICYSTEIFLRAQRCGYLDRGIYHYVIRNDSIMGKGIKNKEEFNDNIVTDLLPLMKEKTSIVYNQGLLELADICKFQYLQMVLEYIPQLYKKKQYQSQYNMLKEEFDKNRGWLKIYLKKRKCSVQSIVMEIACYSVMVYTCIIKAKQYLKKV